MCVRGFYCSKQTKVAAKVQNENTFGYVVHLLSSLVLYVAPRVLRVVPACALFVYVLLGVMLIVCGVVCARGVMCMCDAMCVCVCVCDLYYS